MSPSSEHFDRWQRQSEGAVCGPVGPVEHIAAMRGLLAAAEPAERKRCVECGAKGAHHPACPMLGAGDYYEQDRSER